MYLHLFEHGIEDDSILNHRIQSWIEHFPKAESIFWTNEKLEDYFSSNKSKYRILDGYITLEEYGYSYKWDIYRIAKYMILYDMGGIGIDLELKPPSKDSVTNLNNIFLAKSFSLERYIVIFKESKMTADQYYQVPVSNDLYSTNIIYSSCIKHGFFYELLRNIAFRTFEKYFKKNMSIIIYHNFCKKMKNHKKGFQS